MKRERETQRLIEEERLRTTAQPGLENQTFEVELMKEQERNLEHRERAQKTREYNRYISYHHYMSLGGFKRKCLPFYLYTKSHVSTSFLCQNSGILWGVQWLRKGAFYLFKKRPNPSTGGSGFMCSCKVIQGRLRKNAHQEQNLTYWYGDSCLNQNLHLRK